MRTLYRFVIAVSLLLVVFQLNATPVSLSDAQKIASKFYMQQKSGVTDVTVIATKTFSSDGIELVSVFSFNSGGFVLMSMDNYFTPVLGYSLTGSHDVTNFPHAAVNWIQDIADGMSIKISQSNYSEMTLHPDWLLIANGEFQDLSLKSGLLPTPDWGQGCYYNTSCPVDAMGSCGHSATGCTATAMAMIMKYWSFPQFGTGEHSYNAQGYGLQSANFGETEYLWANMPVAQPTEENSALATLMYYCGVSVNMAYGTGTSSAAMSPAAFFNYFGYSQSAVMEYQSNYTWTEWVEILKNEIDNGRPVIYAGWEPMLMLGHAFVCDGYDASDYVHLNWGEDGNGNAYFLLPEIAFPANNMIIRNIFPALDCDVKMSQITAPFAHTFTEPAAIRVIVENYSNNPLTDIPITYSVNNSTPVTETITATIDAHGSYEFEFSTLYDFSQNSGMLYNVKVYSELDCDTYHDNDTTVTNILNVSCASIPYSTGFDPNESRDGWLFEDANNDGVSWSFSYGGEPCVYYHGGSGVANDWVFSRCLELETGKLYKLSFDYLSTGMYYPQNLGISIGSGPQSDLMLASLDEILGFINDTYNQKVIYFTVNTTDSYYLGFNCFSDINMLDALLDNVTVSELIDPDIELSEIVSPQTSCELGLEDIVINVRNLYSNIIEELTVSYIVDGGEIVEQLFHPNLLSGNEIELTFEIPADLSLSGSHSLKVFTSLVGDVNNENDTILITVENRNASYAPYLCEFETAAEYEFYAIENLNEDNRTWQFISAEGHTNPGCVRYDYHDFNAANDWLITKCIYLEQQYGYKLSFWNKIEQDTWPENLKVAIGEIQTSAGMTSQLNDYPGLTNATWKENTINFTVGTDGYYYIGFYCYSAAQMFNLYIDDIEITEDGINNVLQEKTEIFSIYPNPANDIIYLKTNAADASDFVVEICDMQGKIIIETTMNGCDKSLNIEMLETGIYFINIRGENAIKNYRFVKL